MIEFGSFIKPIFDGFRKHVLPLSLAGACAITGWLVLILGLSNGRETTVPPVEALGNVTDWFGWTGGTSGTIQFSAWLQDPARASALGLVATWVVPLLTVRWDGDRVGDSRSLATGSIAWALWLVVAQGVGYETALRSVLPLVTLWILLNVGYWLFIEIANKLGRSVTGPIKQWPQCFWCVFLTPMMVLVVPALYAGYILLLPTPWSPLGMKQAD